MTLKRTWMVRLGMRFLRRRAKRRMIELEIENNDLRAALKHSKELLNLCCGATVRAAIEVVDQLVAEKKELEQRLSMAERSGRILKDEIQAMADTSVKEIDRLKFEKQVLTERLAISKRSGGRIDGTVHGVWAPESITDEQLSALRRGRYTGADCGTRTGCPDRHGITRSTTSRH